MSVIILYNVPDVITDTEVETLDYELTNALSKYGSVINYQNIGKGIYKNPEDARNAISELNNTKILVKLLMYLLL